jgi:hypothetical protein
MIDLISKIFDKHTWFNLLVILIMLLSVVSGLVILTYYFPVSFQLQTNVIRDETYETHYKTYRTWSTIEKQNGAIVHLSITNKVTVKRDNLVEKPVT